MDQWSTAEDTIREALTSFIEGRDLESHAAHLRGREDGEIIERRRIVRQIAEKLGVSEAEAEALVAPPKPVPDPRTLDDMFREDAVRVLKLAREG